MVNSNKIKGLIKTAGMTQAECARKIGISAQSLNAKINGKTEFNSEEIVAFRDLFDLGGQVESIFFANRVD